MMNAQEVVNVIGKIIKEGYTFSEDDKKFKIIDKNRRVFYIDIESNSRIKSCPFCNEKDDTKLDKTIDDQYYVTCESCGSNGPESDDKFEAIDLWNRVK